MNEKSTSAKKIAKKLSTDKPFEVYNKKLPDWCQSDFIIYANGTRWVLFNWCQWTLYWIPQKEDLKEKLNSFDCEYKATWLTDSQHIKNIENIIWKHPNLTDFRLTWLPVWMIKLITKLGLR